MKILLLLTLVAILSAARDKCRVLSMSGWGDQGAYTIGALKALVDFLPAEEVQYDVVSGNACGSLNATVFSLFKQGKEKEATEYLESLWLNIKGYTDIYESSSWITLISALFSRNYLYNTAPLEEMIKKEIEGKCPQKELVIGATNLDNGTYKHLNFNCSDKDKFAKSVLASSSIPVFFPPVELDDGYYAFGDLLYDIHLAEAVNSCKKKGFADNQIYIDVLLASRNDPGRTEDKFMNALQNLYRYLEIFSYYSRNANFEQFFLEFPDVNVRYLVSPKEKLPSHNSYLDFKPEAIKETLEKGYAHAKEMIESGKQFDKSQFLDNIPK